jgi:hypothetical protein
MRLLTLGSGIARPWNEWCTREGGAADSHDCLSHMLVPEAGRRAPPAAGRPKWLAHYFAGSPVKRIPAVCTL